jgi:hypothetical protein
MENFAWLKCREILHKPACLSTKNPAKLENHPVKRFPLTEHLHTYYSLCIHKYAETDPVQGTSVKGTV